MPIEDIGECDIGQMAWDRDWIVFQLEMGINYLKHVCGPPPPGCELEVMWHEHDLGEYPSIGLYWDASVQYDVPWVLIYTEN